MDRFFEFEKAKLFDTWKHSRNNKYSNSKLQEFHDFFGRFYEKIKNEEVSSLSENKRIYLKDAIDYFQMRVNCLSNNTATNAPYELIESIKCAAGEWLGDIGKYIILTRYGDYSFFHDQTEEEVLLYIENDYKEKLDYKTVLLSIPQHYYRDYMNNVVLYHEIGHFVDIVNGISHIAVNLMMEKFSRNEELQDMCDLFPFLQGVRCINNDVESVLKRHWMEYFADLFASSYIGPNIKRYLYYGAYPNSSSSYTCSTHPSNKNRFKVVDDFMEAKGNYVIKIIQESLQGKFGKQLRTYSNTIPPDDLYKLLPVELNTDSDIHCLYATAWDVWYGDRDRFKTENGLTDDLQPTQIYSILNNLVEKSISNYLITKKWNNVPK